MKAAIIGAGFSGRVHAAALAAAGVQPAVVVTAHEDSARRFAAQWGIPVWGTDLALACTEDIDAVHICTPPSTHGRMVRYFLERGKHVLCEKPLCFDAAEAAELAALAERSGLVCALTFNVRYHMACQKAREILASGEMGRVLLVHGNYMQEFNAFPAPLDWRYDEKLAGSMRAVSEIGSHWLDLAAFLTGLEPEAVSASFGCFHEQRVLKDGLMYPADGAVQGEMIHIGTEDAAAVTLRYKGGALGNVLLSEISPGRGNRLTMEITCQYGNLWWNEEDNNLLHTARKGEGVHTQVFAFGNGFDDTFTTLLKEVYAAVRAGAPDKAPRYPTFREGARIAAACSAIYASAKNDSRWTSVQEV